VPLDAAAGQRDLSPRTTRGAAFARELAGQGVSLILIGEASRELIEAAGHRGPGAVYPDLAFSLAGALQARSPAADPPVVGINPMPVYDRRYWCVHDNSLYEDYVTELARFADTLITAGRRVVLWSTQPRDELVVVDVLDALEARRPGGIDRTAMTRAPRTVAELVAALRELDVAVATRFHGVVMALWTGLPTLAICYHRKQDDLMRDVGQGDYSLVFERLDADELVARYYRLEADLGSARNTIRGRVEQYRRELDEQYDGLFGPPATEADRHGAEHQATAGVAGAAGR